MARILARGRHAHCARPGHATGRRSEPRAGQAWSRASRTAAGRRRRAGRTARRRTRQCPSPGTGTPSTTVAEHAGDVVAPTGVEGRRRRAASAAASSSPWVASTAAMRRRRGPGRSGRRWPAAPGRRGARSSSVRSPVSRTSPSRLRSTTLRHGWVRTSSAARLPSSTSRCTKVWSRVIRLQRRRRATGSRASRPRGPARSAAPSVTTAVSVVAMPARAGRARTPSAICSCASRVADVEQRRPGRRRVGRGRSPRRRRPRWPRRPRRRRCRRRRRRPGGRRGRRTRSPRCRSRTRPDVAGADGGEPQHSPPPPTCVQRLPCGQRSRRAPTVHAPWRSDTMGAMEWLLLAISVGLVARLRGLRGGGVLLRGGRPRGRREGCRRGRPPGRGRADRAAQPVHPALRRPDRRHPDQPGHRLPGRAGHWPACSRPAEGASACPTGAVPGIAVAIGLVLATVVTMIFGELVPKKMAIALPLPVARRTQALHPRLHQPDDLPDQAAQRLGQRGRAGAGRRAAGGAALGPRLRRARLARRSARPARAPSTPRPPTSWSARWPSARARPARS